MLIINKYDSHETKRQIVAVEKCGFICSGRWLKKELISIFKHKILKLVALEDMKTNLEF